jgi:mannosidase alpha-like ER degradation enhancer 1
MHGLGFVCLRLALHNLTLWSQDWTYPQVSSVGAGIDSFLEYALKWYIMSGA